MLRELARSSGGQGLQGCSIKNGPLRGHDVNCAAPGFPTAVVGIRCAHAQMVFSDRRLYYFRKPNNQPYHKASMGEGGIWSVLAVRKSGGHRQICSSKYIQQLYKFDVWGKYIPRVYDHSWRQFKFITTTQK